MAPEGFDTENWVERLAAILPALAEAQGPYLEDYWRLYPPTHRIMDGSDVNTFPLDDVRMVYMKATGKSSMPLSSACTGPRGCQWNSRRISTGAFRHDVPVTGLWRSACSSVK